MKTRLAPLLAALVVALVLAAPVLAQTSSQDGYSGSAGQVQAQVEDGSGTAATAGSGGGGASLPFTGLDVALLAAAGVLIAGAGIALRRLTRSPGNRSA